jgi:hypothetical protein
MSVNRAAIIPKHRDHGFQCGFFPEFVARKRQISFFIGTQKKRAEACASEFAPPFKVGAGHCRNLNFRQGAKLKKEAEYGSQ